MQACAGQKISADHLETVTTRFLTTEHQRSGLQRLLDHRELALVHLEIEHLPRLVDLGKFWSLQLRFRLIAEIWESLNGRGQLARALLNIFERRHEISKHDCPLGQIFGLPPAFRRTDVYEFPWQIQQQEAKEWLESAPMEEMHEFALQLILLELNAHTHDLRIVWHRGWETTGGKFREVVWVDSLWSAIWESWGWDTNRLSWRRCPHCQRFFYPKRRDQICCTPRQQELWSKRKYAAERRAQEHRQREKGVST